MNNDECERLRLRFEALRGTCENLIAWAEDEQKRRYAAEGNLAGARSEIERLRQREAHCSGCGSRLSARA